MRDVRHLLIRFVRPLLGLGLFALALALLGHQLREHDPRDVMAQLRAIPAARVLLALALTVVSYVVLTGYDVLALRHVGHRLSYGRTALTSFIAYVFSQDLGLNVLGGFAIRLRLLGVWGVPAADVTRIVAFNTSTFWLGLLLLGGSALAFEAPVIPASLGVPLSTTRPLGLLLLALLALYLAGSVLRRRPIRLGSFELPVPPLSTALVQAGWAAVDWLVAASVLFVLLPETPGLSFPAFVGIFVAAQLLGVLSTVPAGLGVVEGVVTALLAPHVSPAAAMGALVAWRAVYTLVPIFVALALLAVFEALQRRAALSRATSAAAAAIASLVTPALSLGVGVAGLVLVVVGAAPTAASHVQWLRSTASLSWLEASHAVTTLAGVGLVFLARGLRQRVRAAAWASGALLALACAGSLLRGGRVALAAVLAGLLVALWLVRARFDRAGTPLAFGPSPRAQAALAGAALCLVAVAAWSVEEGYSHALWLHASWSGDAARALRAGGIAAAALLAWAAFRIGTPRPPPAAAASADELETVAHIVADAPDTSAHLALLGDKRFLLDAARTAFVMYGVSGRSFVAMGDPVGPPDRHAELAWRLREESERYGGWPVFYEVSARDLPVYVDLGLSLHKLGEEARVPLADFTLEGHDRRGLRQTRNRLERQGARFELVSRDGVPPLLDELEAVSDEWLLAKSTREKGFSLGSFRRDYLSRLPAALVRVDERIVAFANVWPGGGRSELSIDLMRHRGQAPPGVMEYLFSELMLWGRAEGYAWFSLGMAPLSGLGAHPLAPVWGRAGGVLFRHGEHFYNFRGLRQYKQKFDPVWEPRFLASPGGLSLARVLANVATLVSGGARGLVGR